MADFNNSPLYRIMHPRSIAIWGASNNPLPMGSIQLTQLLALGFEGAIYPMHRTETEVMGLRAYSRVADIPGPVDLACLVLPTDVVPDTLEECGKAGIKSAIVVSAGFGEAGPDGKQLENRVVQIARKYGICFLGPNCIGVVNPRQKFNITFCPYDASPGFIGMASQSGSFVTQMFVHLEKFGVGFSQAFSVGNEAMTDLTDCLEYLGQCPDTKVIGLYIEGIRRGREFFRVARKVSKTKPIVAFYVGGSKSGSRAALSHTGALAGSDDLYEGIFRQCGIIRAKSIEELFDLCYVLGSQPLPRGKRLAILTHSGGPGATASDSADRCGLELAGLSPATVEALKPLVPRTASIRNPVDLTFAKSYSDYMGKLPSLILADEAVDLLFLYCLIPQERVLDVVQGRINDPAQALALTEKYIKDQCQAAAQLAATYGKPVVGATFCTRSELFVRELQDRGFPCLPSPERAVNALAALARYSQNRKALILEDEG